MGARLSGIAGRSAEIAMVNAALSSPCQLAQHIVHILRQAAAPRSGGTAGISAGDMWRLPTKVVAHRHETSYF